MMSSGLSYLMVSGELGSGPSAPSSFLYSPLCKCLRLLGLWFLFSVSEVVRVRLEGGWGFCRLCLLTPTKPSTRLCQRPRDRERLQTQLRAGGAGAQCVRLQKDTAWACTHASRCNILMIRSHLQDWKLLYTPCKIHGASVQTQISFYCNTRSKSWWTTVLRFKYEFKLFVHDYKTWQ